MLRRTIAAATTAFALLAPARAEARTVQDERYAFEITWNAAVRLIRVDLGCVITERDRESGFVLFTYPESGRSTQGSLEIVRAEVDGTPGTRVIVQLTQLPTYMERHIATRLDRKLHEEYGEPPPIRRAPPPAVPAREGETHGDAPGSTSSEAPRNPPPDPTARDAAHPERERGAGATTAPSR